MAYIESSVPQPYKFWLPDWMTTNVTTHALKGKVTVPMAGTGGRIPQNQSARFI